MDTPEPKPTPPKKVNVEQFIEDVLGDDDDDGPKGSAIQRQRLAKAKLDEMKLAVMQGKYMLHEVHEQILTALGLELVRALDSLERRLPPRLDGVSAREAQAVLHEAHRDMRERLSRVRGGPIEGLRRGRGQPRKKRTA